MNNAGTWWLKGAWIELGLEQAMVDVIDAACQHYRAEKTQPPLRVLTHALAVVVRKNETLAFMPLFERMTRLPHLDTYTDDGLNWLAEALQVYRAETMASYLSELTRLKIASALGQALARCYWQAWYQNTADPDRHVCYVDMHDKVIWSEQRGPVGFVSTMHEVHTCLKQVFVHGHAGHPLLCLTYPADVHLSEVVLTVAQALDQAIGQPVVQVIVTDREGLAQEVISAALGQNKAFVTLLKANQYAGEADFVRHGRFRQIKNSRTGQASHRVADADYTLADTLPVRAGMIYDLDHPDDLIAMVTTVSRTAEPDIRHVVGWYLGRWNAQENSFREQIAFVHLNTNFGLRAKREVPNRQETQHIADLATHLAAVETKLNRKIAQLAEQEQRIHALTARYDKKTTQLLQPRQRHGPQAPVREAKRKKQLHDYQECYHQRLARYLKQKTRLEQEIEGHRQELARVAAELAALDPQATFFEVDTEKDQIMTHLRIGLHSSALWVRDQYFSSTYRHSTPLTLWRTFFNQDGFYRETVDHIVITLKPFTDSRIQREAVKACRQFTQRHIKTLSGKIIEMHVAVCI